MLNGVSFSFVGRIDRWYRRTWVGDVELHGGGVATVSMQSAEEENQTSFTTSVKRCSGGRNSSLGTLASEKPFAASAYSAPRNAATAASVCSHDHPMFMFARDTASPRNLMTLTRRERLSIVLCRPAIHCERADACHVFTVLRNVTRNIRSASIKTRVVMTGLSRVHQYCAFALTMGRQYSQKQAHFNIKGMKTTGLSAYNP